MLSGPKTFIGQGATSAVSLVGVPLPNNYGEVPIAILGAGPAGIMAARSLRELGFRNIELIEKRDENGIWAQPNVYNGSRNNPRDVDFSGIQKLIAAPGNGYEVVNFLHRLLNVEVKKKSLSRVEPGNLRHKLFFDGLKTPKTFPIVINAMGLGKPNPISDGERMIGNPGRAVPKRWQQPRLELKDVEKKRFIFIGLGNSTAEMIRKLHDFEDQGYEVDYRILTHYPRDSVFAPSDTVIVREKGFRVFRDISKPQLVSFQGDLPSSRADYYRALMNGRIISDIRQWIVGGSGKEIAAFDDDGVSLLNISFDDLYVLTGYGHSPEAYASMGCTYDNDLSCALHDYDGEIIQRKGAAGGERVYKGYFGFGAVLDAPHNPNTVVIPGMAYRLPDLLFGVIMRAGEYVQAKK
jgi:hypothetical protein